MFSFLTFSFRTFDWKVGCCTIWKSVVVVSQGYQIRWQMFDRFHHQSDRLFRWVLPCKANLLIDRFDAWNDLIQILLENLCAHHHRHHVYSGLDSWSGVYPVVGQPCNREHSPTQQVSWWCSVRGYPGHEVYPGPGYPRWDRTPSPHQARWTELLQAWRSDQTWWCKVDLVLESTYTDKNKKFETNDFYFNTSLLQRWDLLNKMWCCFIKTIFDFSFFFFVTWLIQ